MSKLRNVYFACNVLESYPSCRCYNNLRPERRLVLDSVSSFVSSVNSSLRAGTVRSYKFCVEFRLDVFKFLFSNKGTLPESGAGRLYEECDFSPEFFNDNWFVTFNKLGNGCSVDSPIRSVDFPKLTYGPKCYTKDSIGNIIAKQRSFNEVVIVTLLKRDVNIKFLLLFD